MDLSKRSDFLDKMVRLAVEQGSQEVRTMRGSGYLLSSKKRTLGKKYIVAYEIVILFNPTEKRAGALGSMIGNPDALERAMRAGGTQLNYSPGLSLDIGITNLEVNRAHFRVLSPIGI